MQTREKGLLWQWKEPWQRTHNWPKHHKKHIDNLLTGKGKKEKKAKNLQPPKNGLKRRQARSRRRVKRRLGGVV